MKLWKNIPKSKLLPFKLFKNPLLALLGTLRARAGTLSESFSIKPHLDLAAFPTLRVSIMICNFTDFFVTKLN